MRDETGMDSAGIRRFGIGMCIVWLVARVVEAGPLALGFGGVLAPIEDVRILQLVAHYAFVTLCVLCAITGLRRGRANRYAWIVFMCSLLIVFPLELSTTMPRLVAYFVSSAISITGVVIAAWLFYRTPVR
jgi:multidrug transporter EmrE-like cation transporter